MNHRKQKLQSQLGVFLQQYGRKAHAAGNDPNDRNYSRKLESRVKRMKPEQFDELLNGADDDVPAQPDSQP